MAPSRAAYGSTRLRGAICGFLHSFEPGDALLEARDAAKSLLSRRLQLLLPGLEVKMDLLQALGYRLDSDRQSDHCLPRFSISAFTVRHARPRDGQYSTDHGGDDLLDHWPRGLHCRPV